MTHQKYSRLLIGAALATCTFVLMGCGSSDDVSGSRTTTSEQTTTMPSPMPSSTTTTTTRQIDQ